MTYTLLIPTQICLWAMHQLYLFLPQININKLDVLKMVPYTHSKRIVEYGNITSYQKETRMQEIIESIQNTLNHEYVGYLHIFYQDLLLIPYIENQNLNNSHKITFVPNMDDTMSTLFHYANEHLEGHMVMVMNADTYPVEGFEHLDFEYLRTQKLMYCLSR